MSKPFNTYNALIELMRNRNISIQKGDEERKVKEILSRDNYYCIINGYKEIFIDKASTEHYSDDHYVDGTTFDQIYAVFCFDRNLRSILLQALLEAEQNIGTKVAYRFAENNPRPFSHLDINNFSTSDLSHVTKLISKLTFVTQRNSNNETVFHHYLTKHKDLPLWVLVTKLTFGEITNFYKAISTDLQIKILNDLLESFQKQYNCDVDLEKNPNYENEFKNILDILVEYRNVCAHGDRLYRFRVTNKKTIKKINYFFINSPKGAESSFYGVLLSLMFFISRNSYNILISNCINELKSLESILPTTQFNLLLQKMELTLKWEESLKKLQE